MAKEAVFKFSDISFTGSLSKIERKKMYGFTDLIITDPEEKVCEFATLTEDGMHILPTGSSGIMTLNSQGNYINRNDGKVVDAKGEEVSKVPSIYDQDVELTKVSSINEYLDMNVKAIYQLEVSENKDAILAALEEHKLFHLIYNYRADYEGDDAYLISNEEEVFMIVGNKINFEYIGLEEVVIETDSASDKTEESDDFDFGML